MSKILFYFSDFGANVIRRERDTYGGVGYYRVVKPANMVKGHEIDVVGVKLTKKGETEEERWERIFKEYDVFWTSYFSDPKEAAAMFYTRDKYKKKVIVDCDDNYLDILESHPQYDKLKSGKKDKALMSTILSFADVITVSTEPLMQRLRKHFKEVHGLEKNIIVIPNMNDIKEYSYPLAQKNTKKLVIGYAGSNSHQDDMALFIPQLLKIMRKYPYVWFESIGSIGKSDLHLFKDFLPHEMNRCDLMPPTWTFKEYPEMLCNLKWDIAIAPLVDSKFTRCKSHIKFMEMASIKTPIICSRVYPYFMDIKGKKVAEHGKTALVVKPSGWYDAMEYLILNPEKRRELGENAYKHVVANWQYDKSDLSKIIDEVLAS